MSRIYKCDLCGKIYEPYTVSAIDIRNDIGTAQLAQAIETKLGIIKVKRSFDICTSCAEDFNELLRRKTSNETDRF